MGSREAPEPWASAMIEAGCVVQRNKDPRPSMRQLAERAETSVSTIIGLIFGDRGETDPAVVSRVTTVLGQDAATIAAWRARTKVAGEPYAPPEVSRLLTRTQRKALDQLIRSIVVEEGGSRGSTAPMITGTAGQPASPAGAPPGADPPPSPPPPGPDATAPGVATGREEPSRRHGPRPTRGGGRR